MGSDCQWIQTDILTVLTTSKTDMIKIRGLLSPPFCPRHSALGTGPPSPPCTEPGGYWLFWAWCSGGSLARPLSLQSMLLELLLGPLPHSEVLLEEEPFIFPTSIASSFQGGAVFCSPSCCLSFPIHRQEIISADFAWNIYLVHPQQGAEARAQD